jgi:hypothetical protein
MKIIKFILITILILLAFGFGMYIVDSGIFKRNTLPQTPTAKQTYINDYKETIISPTPKIELPQNPQFIYETLEDKGNIIVFTSKVSYPDIIEQKTTFASRKITINLRYNFGMSADLSKISILKIDNDIVTVKVPKDIKLEYLELVSKEMFIETKDKSLFARNISSAEAQEIIKKTEEKIRTNITNTKQIYNTSYENYKEIIEDLIINLGYNEVIFKS